MKGEVERICDFVRRGDMMIIAKSVRVEVGRRHEIVSMTVELSSGSPRSRDRDFMARLRSLLDQDNVEVLGVRPTYDHRQTGVEVEFQCSPNIMSWLDPTPQRISGLDQGFAREHMGRPYGDSPRPTPRMLRGMQSAPPPSTPRMLNHQRQSSPQPRHDDHVDALTYAMKTFGTAAESATRDLGTLSTALAMPTTQSDKVQRAIPVNPVDARPDETFYGVDLASAEDTVVVAVARTDMSSSSSMLIIDDPYEARQTTNEQLRARTLEWFRDNCVAGNPTTHKWVDQPLEGPTAKRCSGCGRVTGHFWRPDEKLKFMELFVAIVKVCVRMWAESLDDTSVRFALLEMDRHVGGVKFLESDDAAQRFSLLELDK